ncbi:MULTISPECIES: FCD domain-containing protein [Alphaproteobacteria]|uniref:FadR/GntR family transcriptional regulator n=2 Tax=Pseudomonadota TaxID=1224 RepID=UPI00317739F3
MNETTAVSQRLRDLIDSAGYRLNDRILPERELCKRLDTTRNQLRKALADLEAQGLIWRHVGRGTFVGSRPVLNLQDVTYLRDQIKPEQVITVRYSIEPELARLAAKNASKSDCEQMKICAEKCCEAKDWRAYEAWDNKLHHVIARGTRNQLYLYFFETLNSVRRSIVWGQPRDTRKPGPGYTSFVEHDAIVRAITARNGELAMQMMQQHLRSVYSRMMPEVVLGED